MRSPAPATLILVAAAAVVRAQTPAGPEFVVNTYTTGDQTMPSIAMGPAGDFVAVWQGDEPDNVSQGVFAQRFAADGVPRGAEFLVNVWTTGTQRLPDVAMDPRGGFVVVWVDGDRDGIKGRRFDRSGAPAGGEFAVSDYTGITNYPSVSMDPAGGFVVVWHDRNDAYGGYGVSGHRFDATGASRGADFQINTYTTGDQVRAEAATFADGSFVVAFQGPDASGSGVFARRYDAAGAPAGPETPLATAASSQFLPRLASLRSGGFVAVWGGYPQDGSFSGVYARMFDAAGGPVTGELVVNSYTTGNQYRPMIAVDGQGFVVMWQGNGQGDSSGIFGQRFEASGARRGGEFAVNSYTTGAQQRVAVAATEVGNFTATWFGPFLDGAGFGILARRFQALLPAALAVDPLGNNVLEPQEVARVQPTWRNATTSAHSVAGSLSAFAGPAPGLYTIDDAAASYGSIGAGASQSCGATGDCYAVSVSAPARPAVHWDATVLETPSGSPITDGLAKRWTLHVGDSFADVPQSNGFYRFIEALLHFGVTSGCGGSSYCQSSPTTREQMAVFVLVAREGASYAPPACGTPVFADVPASSGFCRWIEELARRGVAGGCGGGNYCPAAPVTREQMAVFVLRTLDPGLNPPPCAPPNLYADVPEASGFCPWVEELTVRGVVSGCGGGNYCPLASVTREQMGVFLGVTFGLSLYGP